MTGARVAVLLAESYRWDVTSPLLRAELASRFNIWNGADIFTAVEVSRDNLASASSHLSRNCQYLSLALTTYSVAKTSSDARTPSGLVRFGLFQVNYSLNQYTRMSLALQLVEKHELARRLKYMALVKVRIDARNLMPWTGKAWARRIEALASANPGVIFVGNEDYTYFGSRQDMERLINLMHQLPHGISAPRCDQRALHVDDCYLPFGGSRTVMNSTGLHTNITFQFNKLLESPRHKVKVR